MPISRDDKPNRFPLCVFSQAAGGSYVDHRGLCDGNRFNRQAECPLDLTRAQGQRCPCKKRMDAGEVKKDRGQIVPVQVAACVFPETWNGEMIRNPNAFAAYLRRRGRVTDAEKN
jgi:hypothetical protein